MAVESCGGIYALSEDCISQIISFTSPEDACRLAAVDSRFLSASESDIVWNTFLLRDYGHRLSRAAKGLKSKKDMYNYLSGHDVFIDGGLKSCSLDKRSGAKCLTISTRDPDIVLGNTPEVWNWISHPNSKFSKAAELKKKCRLEIHGRIRSAMLSPGITYAAYLVFQIFKFPRISGFMNYPAEAFIVVNGREIQNRRLLFDSHGAGKRRYPTVPMSDEKIMLPREREDGWMDGSGARGFCEERGRWRGFASDTDRKIDEWDNC